MVQMTVAARNPDSTQRVSFCYIVFSKTHRPGYVCSLKVLPYRELITINNMLRLNCLTSQNHVNAYQQLTSTMYM